MITMKSHSSIDNVAESPNGGNKKAATVAPPAAATKRQKLIDILSSL